MIFLSRKSLFGASALLHAGLLAYGSWQDAHFTKFGGVMYTDVDYLVFTDAAEHVLAGGSPYNRTTYRYTPLLAIWMVPNITCHPLFGKVLFSICNLSIGYFISRILEDQKLVSLGRQYSASKCSPSSARRPKSPSVASPTSSSTTKKGRDASPSSLNNFLLALWLLNPIAAQVATRGNADAIPALLVVLFIFLLRRRKVSLGALVFGFAVHFKIYPSVMTLPALILIHRDFWTNLTEPIRSLIANFHPSVPRVAKRKNERPLKVGTCARGAVSWILSVLTLDVLKFALISASVFFGLTLYFYRRYGWPFLYEGYLYHLERHDHRHNLSPFFYFMYLTHGGLSSTASSMTAAACRICSLVAFVTQWISTFAVGAVIASRGYVDVAVFAQTVLFVAFNKVCTVQYFIWWLVLLPAALGAVRDSPRFNKWFAFSFSAAFTSWLVTQALWLACAYRQEFLGVPSFREMFACGWLFFGSTIWLCLNMIRIVPLH